MLAASVRNVFVALLVMASMPLPALGFPRIITAMRSVRAIQMVP